MEPIDILGLKDPAVLAEPPRRPIEVIKSKKQFEYSRLKEDDAAGRSSPITASSTAKNSPTINEDLLLIDLSPDQPPVPDASIPRSIYDQPAEFPGPVSDLDRIYANYPVGPGASAFNGAVTSSSIDRYESHYYSQVPVEPISPVPALLPCAPPSNPVSPIKPFVSEEMKKKRDEAFDWLGQALGEMSVKKTSENKHYDNQCNLPLSIADNELRTNPVTSSHYGFDDDFSVAMDGPSKPKAAASLETSAFFRHQQQSHLRPMDGIRQPYYPKPGVWTMEETSAQHQPEVTSSSPFSAVPSGQRSAGVQTAHVRPFVVAAPVHSANNNASTSFAVNQVRLSTPWASEAEIKQALAIHSNKPLEAVRFLQVEKLYR